MTTVNFSDETITEINILNEDTINTKVQDINYIPGYKIAEEERRKNELERIANEKKRESQYADLNQKVEVGYFKGDKGDKGPSNILSIGTVKNGEVASATLTGESPNQILNLVLPKGDKGDKGDSSEITADSVYDNFNDSSHTQAYINRYLRESIKEVEDKIDSINTQLAELTTLNEEV